jgi:hypothetical protein
VVLAATLAVVTAAFPELRAAAASQEAALLEVASRVEADMVVGGIKRRIGWTGWGFRSIRRCGGGKPPCAVGLPGLRAKGSAGGGRKPEVSREKRQVAQGGARDLSLW